MRKVKLVRSHTVSFHSNNTVEMTKAFCVGKPNAGGKHTNNQESSTAEGRRVAGTAKK